MEYFLAHIWIGDRCDRGIHGEAEAAWAQGWFENCIPSPIPGVDICTRGWTAQINKKHWGNGTQSSW